MGHSWIGGNGTYPRAWPPLAAVREPLAAPGHGGAHLHRGAASLLPSRLESPAHPLLKYTKCHFREPPRAHNANWICFRKMSAANADPAEPGKFTGRSGGDFKRRLSGTHSISYI